MQDRAQAKPSATSQTALGHMPTMAGWFVRPTCVPQLFASWSKVLFGLYVASCFLFLGPDLQGQFCCMSQDAALNGNQDALREVAAALAPWAVMVKDQHEGMESAAPFDPMKPVLSQVDGSVMEHCGTFLHRMFKELLVPLMMKGAESETAVVQFCSVMIQFFENHLPEDACPEIEETICASLQAWRVVECLWCPGKLDSDAGAELNFILDSKKTSPLYCLRDILKAETSVYAQLVRSFQKSQPFLQKYVPKIREWLRKCSADENVPAIASWLKGALDDLTMFRANLRAGAADEVDQALFKKVEKVLAFAVTEECKVLSTATLESILAALSLAEVLFPRLGNCKSTVITLQDLLRRADCGKKLKELQAFISNYLAKATADAAIHDSIAKIADECQGLIVVESGFIAECLEFVVAMFTLQGAASSDESAVLLGLVKSILSLLSDCPGQQICTKELQWWETVRKLSDTADSLLPAGCDPVMCLSEDTEFRKMKVLLVSLTVLDSLHTEIQTKITDCRLEPGIAIHNKVKSQVEKLAGDYLLALAASTDLRLSELAIIQGGMSDGTSWLDGFSVHLSSWEPFREHAAATILKTEAKHLMLATLALAKVMVGTLRTSQFGAAQPQARPNLTLLSVNVSLCNGIGVLRGVRGVCKLLF